MKNYSLVLLVYFISLSLITGLSYFYNIHPYGYSYEVSGDALMIDKGITEKENYQIEFISENIQTIVVMTYIHDFITHWNIAASLISLFPAGLVIFFRPQLIKNLNAKYFATIYSVSLVIVTIFLVLHFNNLHNKIDSLLQSIS